MISTLALLASFSVASFNSTLREVQFNNGTRANLTTEVLAKEYSTFEYIDVSLLNDLAHPKTLSPIPKVGTKPTLPTPEEWSKFLKHVTEIQYEKIKELSSLFDRFYTSKNGVEAHKLVLTWYTEFLRNHPEIESLVEIESVKHKWEQESVIVRFRGAVAPDESYIFSSHLDTTPPDTNPRPGADDNGTGTATLIALFISMVEDLRFRPAVTLEFHTYAAEEVGLLGSKDVAASYKAQGKVVHGVYNFDMTGWNIQNQPASMKLLYGSGTSDEMNDAIRRDVLPVWEGLKQVNEEGKPAFPTHLDHCHTAFASASDHAAWTAQGYHGVFVFEACTFSELYPYYHTKDDTWDKLNQTHSSQFSGLGFLWYYLYGCSAYEQSHKHYCFNW